jgi:hypothetical protein
MCAVLAPCPGAVGITPVGRLMQRLLARDPPCSAALLRLSVDLFPVCPRLWDGRLMPRRLPGARVFPVAVSGAPRLVPRVHLCANCQRRRRGVVTWPRVRLMGALLPRARRRSHLQRSSLLCTLVLSALSTQRTGGEADRWDLEGVAVHSSLGTATVAAVEECCDAEGPWSALLRCAQRHRAEGDSSVIILTQVGRSVQGHHVAHATARVRSVVGYDGGVQRVCQPRVWGLGAGRRRRSRCAVSPNTPSQSTHNMRSASATAWWSR